MKMGVFYGSTTGNTESAALRIKDHLGGLISAVRDVREANVDELLEFEVLFLGVSTWNVGDMQDDWAEFLPNLDQIDLAGKKVALFALGDAWGYSYNFLDAMGELWRKLRSRGAELVGAWPTDGYQFDESQALLDKDHFVGLALDDDNEPELTDERIQAWLVQVLEELGFDFGAEAA